jgi:hypothetical protein
MVGGVDDDPVYEGVDDIICLFNMFLWIPLELLSLLSCIALFF